MACNISFRVFRRNLRNLIVLWSLDAIPDGRDGVVSAFLVGVDGADGPLTATRFKPDSPEKFTSGVDGLVINHTQNNMDPAKSYVIKVVFGDGDCSFEVEKTVLPASSAQEAQERDSSSSKIVHMYGMDYATKTWVPFPVNTELMGEN